MFDILAWTALLGGLACLYRLWMIDLRTGLLPNEYVLGFFMLSCLFHLSTFFHFLTPESMALGAVIGGGSLYLIRAIGNAMTKKDTLGWGDIKLMAAAGVLLGPYYILLAMTAGALAGVLHGLILYIRSGRTVSFGSLSLPAGPGFITGIVIVGMIAFRNLKDIL